MKKQPQPELPKDSMMLMSMRDHFAACALSSLSVHYSVVLLDDTLNRLTTQKQIAAWCSEMADAMLEARKP